jgi:hypothetical protein
METLVGRIFAGHLRSIIGGLTVEEIIRTRDQPGMARPMAAAGPGEGRGRAAEQRTVRGNWYFL